MLDYLKFKIRLALIFSKRMFQSLYDLPQTICSTATTLKYLTGWRFRLRHLHEHKFQETLNLLSFLSPASKINNISSTILISPLEETLFWTKVLILMAIFWILSLWHCNQYTSIRQFEVLQWSQFANFRMQVSALF